MANKIIIAGSGGIGRACGLILLEHFGRDIDLVMADVDAMQCEHAVSWINAGLTAPHSIQTTVLSADRLDNWNPEGQILLDCTPGKYAPALARVALRNQLHYANLTEHVPSTRLIYELAKDAETGFALQTGLAPGFINLLALKSAEEFTQFHPEYTLDRIRMRVGSLSQYASSPSFYAFVWSPMGVSTEYLNESEIINNYQKEIKPSLTGRETIVINGTVYEADFTSGGAADLPDYYNGQIRELNYKTLRYPGHFDYIIKIKNELGDDLSKGSLLDRMMQDIPSQDQDRVLIYCSVSGTNRDKKRFEKIYSREIHPVRLGSITLTAIQRTTASALAQTAALLLSNRYKGILTQSKYPVDEFLNGEIVLRHYGDFFDGHLQKQPADATNGFH